MRNGFRVPLGPLPEGSDERDWAVRGLAKFQHAVEESQRDFLCAATPGAGKTRWALLVGRWLYERGLVDRVVVVTITRHLCTQWDTKSNELGIPLQGDFQNKAKPVIGYIGQVVTYAQVASNSQFHRTLCQTRTLVILDEPHHLGEGEAKLAGWGPRIREAFEGAEYRLLITGTPFRTDGLMIPFTVEDPVTGFCHVDFPYSYGDALSDRVVREVIAPGFDGEATWKVFGEDRIRSARIRDDLEDKDRTAVRRTMLTLDEWLEAVITAADLRLTSYREDVNPRAAGLIIAYDKEHANHIARIVQRITGVKPVVVHSDVPGASDLIDRFEKGDARWIVAVKMISEGVDIPRLCIGVYATLVRTELYFRQFVGRFVRVSDGFEDVASFIYIPQEPVLVRFVQRLLKERDGVRHRPGGDGPGPGTMPIIEPITIDSEEHDINFIDGIAVTPAEVAAARAEAAKTGLAGNPGFNPLFLAKYLKVTTGGGGAGATTGQARTSTENGDGTGRRGSKTITEQRSWLRTESNYWAHRVAARDGIDPAEVMTELKRRIGAGAAEASPEQLTRRLEIATDWWEHGYH